MDLEADEEEDDRIEGKGPVLPERAHRHPDCRRHTTAHDVAPAHNPRRHGRQHTGDAELLRQCERPVGRDHGQGDLDHGIGDARDRQRHRGSDDSTDQRATNQDAKKPCDRGDQSIGSGLRRGREGEGRQKQCDGGRIVEQALRVRQ